jgi:hypothetical protein
MNLEKPVLPINIPSDSQWLSGVGAGSWFTMETEQQEYRIKRFSPEGKLECDRLFTVDDNSFKIKTEYQFTYLSHCKECTIIQNEITYKFYTNEY